MQNLPLIHKLFDLGAVKFGSFTLKNGMVSPIYIDLRLTISSPKLLLSIGDALWNAAQNPRCDLVCGVPYTALPFATVISIQHNVPMVMRRKERKDYGTKKLIEGIFERGQKCLVVEDVITSGQSVLEVTQSLESEGLISNEVAVLVDREQGGRKILQERGYRVHAVCTLTEIVNVLFEDKKISAAAADEALQFIKGNQVHG